AVSILVQLLDIWFVWALLRTFNKQRRFLQTMTALLAAETLFTLAGAPLAPLVPVSTSNEQQLTLPLFLIFLLGVWSIDVAAFVFSRAIERPYLLCVAIMLGYVLLIFSLQASLLPLEVA
ncbi:MAG TPA: hypothetical protein VM692_04875, partial [Gammaproteobacteria bacterium]|nr:hypothetical protein [Gammaproteobacteria bacterium]